MDLYRRALALLIGVIVGLCALAPPVAHAQECAQMHAPDYAPVVEKGCGNWLIQIMDHTDPRFGSRGWQLDDHGKRYVLVANYRKSSDGINYEMFRIVDHALLVDDADLRIGKARPLREDRIDAELEQTDFGLYFEQSYAEAMGMVSR